MAPVIIQVPRDHDRFQSIETQFRKKWLHTQTSPQVRAIYKIVNKPSNVAKYKSYLDRVEARGNFASQDRFRGNENRRWHGTMRKCKIGDEGVTSLCADSSCSLCGILRSSFDLSVRTQRYKRFGMGIYTSSTSSKAGDYSVNGSVSNRKALLLNNVVVGCGHKLTADNTALVRPPVGFDSVIGEVGNVLNYDELVVYDNDAILPSYLVMYDNQG